MKNLTSTVLRAQRLLRTPLDGPVAAIEDAVVEFDTHVTFVGSATEYLDASHPDRALRAARFTECVLHPLITPGLVDAHTHGAWAGSRHNEYAWKVAGVDYRTIAAQGGGIVASQKHLAEIGEVELRATLRARLERMASLGVTTVEVKSGYGLTPELETKQLQAINAVSQDPRLPRIVPTLLALHAVPPPYRERRAEYLASQASFAREVAQAKLAQCVDAYIDANAFSPQESRAILEAARADGLRVRLHVGQFADIGGAELACDVGADSVDHVEVLSDASIHHLAKAGVRATMLPTACFVLRQTPPDVARLQNAGIRLVVASDANPGTAPSESLPLAMMFAFHQYRMTAESIWRGVTSEAAAALNLLGANHSQGPGDLALGASADLVVFKDPHEDALLQPWGTPRTQAVYRDGVRIDRPVSC
jgi:imidazolonepropionase